MNAADQIRAKGGVDCAVAVDPAHRAEGLGSDVDAEVALAAFAIARVAEVRLAFVLDFQLAWLERRLEPLPDFPVNLHFSCLPPSNFRPER